RSDDVDLLTAVRLIPEGLEDLANRRAVAVPAVHEPRHIREAHVACLQFLVIEHADAAAAGLSVPLEREVHFLDAVTLGARAELRFRARRSAAEQDVVFSVHVRSR